MVEVVLKIPNMSCEHCVRTISMAIERAGALGNVSLKEKKAVVEFDPGKVRLEEIVKSIERYGYEVEVV